jgi:hypothetical protein
MAISSCVPADVGYQRQLFYRISKWSFLGSGAVSTRRSFAYSECHNLQKVPFHGGFLEPSDAREIKSLMTKRKSLEQAPMSLIGTKQTSQRCFAMSAFGGKADIV